METWGRLFVRQMISIFEARITEQTKNNFLTEKNNNFYLSFLKT